MKKLNVLAIALLAALLMGSIYAVSPVKAPARSDVDVRFYGSHDTAYAALKAGDVDFIQWSVTYEQKLDVEDDPDLCVAGYSENGMMEFDLNNNYTMPDLPGVKNPVTDKHFRRALSCAVEKTHIIDFILKGAAGLLNVPIPLNSISWWPDSVLPENYEWQYNMTKAAEQLALAGFVDTDTDDIVNYPADWPGRPGQPNMDPLKVCVRTEDKRLDAGRYFCDQITLLGIPYNKIEATSDVHYPIVMDDRNYHVYTGGWSLGRYPLFLYNGFHESFWYEGGSNYVTGMNSSNLPNYPDFDELARAVYYTESIATCKVAAKAAAHLGWADYVFNIPLWSYDSYVAWRTTMPGVINEFGYGYDNMYQFLNAYKPGGVPIRMGTISAPKSLNPLYATWYYDYAVLDRVYNALLTVNPYDLGIDQPGAAQDWEVGTWVDPDPGPEEPAEKNKVTYYLRKDVGVISPTGTFMRNLNAYDLEFSCWYTYCFDDGWNWADYQDVHHTNVVDDYTIEFYFDDASYWFYTAPQYPEFPKTELIDTLCTTTSTTFTVAGNVTADTNYWILDPVVDVISDDIPVDYKIVAGYETNTHTGISFDAVPADGTYTITYYTPDLDPHGYYLAGLDWTETWYSYGPFYPISITPGVGGYVSFNKNPYYWMETPPLGETDWRWIWETPGGIPGPSNPGRDGGHFKIEIYDVVKATASYCHYGSGPYDSKYFPGGDLDASDIGHVGIYDVVSITGKYAMEWGAPPP
jgi:ABC-type transport system substrate-binding protein